jgi:hypothetical protein
MSATSNTMQMAQPKPRSLVSKHKLRSNIHFRYQVIALIGLAGALAALLAGYWRAQYASSHFGPAVVWRWFSPSVWAAGGLAILGLVGLWGLLRNRKLRVYTHTQGLQYRRGRKTVNMLWREIEFLHTRATRYGIPGLAWGGETALILQAKSGKRIRLTQSLTRMKHLVSTIKEHVYPPLLADYIRIFNQGDPLYFGQLVLTSRGLLKGRQAVRWEDLDAVGLNRGFLEIRPKNSRHSKKIRVAAHKIPNVDLCMQLIKLLGTRP